MADTQVFRFKRKAGNSAVSTPRSITAPMDIIIRAVDRAEAQTKYDDFVKAGRLLDLPIESVEIVTDPKITDFVK